MRIARLVVILSVVAAVPVTGSAAPSAAVHVADLALDEAAWWDGDHVGSSPLHSLPLVSLPIPDRCQNVDPCFLYTLNVEGTSPTARLRVGLDTASRDDGFEMTLFSPGGTTTSATNGNSYSMEVFAPTPAVGMWTVRVLPTSADHATFRMRAKLEPEPWKPATQGWLLPNLRVTRLWEFGFAAPAHPGNGTFPSDDTNPPLSVLGYEPVSCAADEQLGFDNPEQARRCLRYSFGLANAGEGNFDVRYTSNPSTMDSVPMTQCIQNSDPAITPAAKPAGSGAFHHTHGHFHYNDIIFHDAWRIDDTTTWARTKVGTGKKIGYSPADQGIADWAAFTQMPRGTAGSAGNCTPGSGNRLGMAVGWGDAYRYQRPGNYVEFSEGSDGRFVVRTIADPNNVVEESNEDDNTAYAYITVWGNDVDVIEAGIGQGPWDPNKVLFER